MFITQISKNNNTITKSKSLDGVLSFSIINPIIQNHNSSLLSLF